MFPMKLFSRFIRERGRDHNPRRSRARARMRPTLDGLDSKLLLTAAPISSIAATMGTIVGLPPIAPAQPASVVVLNPGQSLSSPGGRYQLTLTTTGDLVEYGPGHAVLWQSGSAGRVVDAVLQQGNLEVMALIPATIRPGPIPIVLPPTIAPIWQTNTGGHLGATLNVQANGNVVISGPAGNPIWASNTVQPAPSLVLTPGEAVYSANQQFKLYFDTNGDLAEYDAVGKQLWHTGTAGQAAIEVDLIDGNLVLYGAGYQTLWSSKTGGFGGSTLAVQDDGMVTIDTANGQLLWSTSTTEWPSQVFDPFVDMTGGGYGASTSLASLAAANGTSYLALGFITPDANGKPAWGDTAYGNSSTYGTGVANAIKALQAQGGDAMISFGGANPTVDASTGKALTDGFQELAQAVAWSVTNGVPAATETETTAQVATLEADYQSVIDTYHVNHLNFDIEGAALDDTTANDLRAQALAQLENANPGLVVSFTLPVDVNGLQADAQALLANAASNHVAISSVNLMTMDFNQQLFTNGYSQDDPTCDMAYYAEQAAGKAIGQLQALQQAYPGMTTLVGLTPELGAGDDADSNEVFDTTNAQQLVAWAEQADSGVVSLSMWSVDRDDASHDFANIFKSF